MAECVATIWGKEVCGKETRPGYKFCEEHSNRKKAIEERENKSYAEVIDLNQAFVSSEVVAANAINVESYSQPRNIVDKTNDVLDRSLTWEDQTWREVQGLPKEQWYKEDKTGILQPHPAIGVNERAQDRVIRAVTAIAKLGIEAQGASINKMTRELIKSVVVKAMEKAGFNPDEINKVRLGIAEEFERIANESG